MFVYDRKLWLVTLPDGGKVHLKSQVVQGFMPQVMVAVTGLEGGATDADGAREAKALEQALAAKTVPDGAVQVGTMPDKPLGRPD